ncbi:MAG: TonB-dependent receptor [Cytophagaceae bacterium]|nr:TonB-dependent receptor [Cytophagaceae bacterium]
MNKFYLRGRNVSGFGLDFKQSTSLFSVLFSLFLSVSVFAQDLNVSGKVTDGSGSGLPGATVQVKGTNKGTSTDVDGNYKLAGVASNATLVISSVGMATQELAVDGRTVINVSLKDDAALLEEVVVVGYGTQKVKDATGAIASIGSKDFNKGIINSPDQMLAGRVAGVQVTPNSGDPGAGVNITIRGTASLRGNNTPLYVVDGVPLDGGNVTPTNGGNGGVGSVAPRNPLNFLNPADIENISILKDASAAAIYGSRGANGVVLITTKRGKSGAGTFNFSANTAVSTPAQKYQMLDKTEFLAQLGKAGLDLSSKLNNGGNDNDWQKEIYRTGITQSYNMSFGGGSDKTSYYFSLAYQDQQGIIKNSSQNRLQGRINASHKLFDNKVVVGVNLTTANINDEYAPISGDIGYEGNLVARAISTNPTFPILNPDGSYYTTGTVSFRNPVSMLNQINIYGPTNRTMFNPYATWNIIKGLTYKVSFGMDNSTSTLNRSIDVGTPGFNNTTNGGKGFASIVNLNKVGTTLEHTLNYIKTFGKSNLDLLGGFAYYKYENVGSGLDANFFIAPAGFPLLNNLGFVDNTGSNKAYSGGSYKNLSELQSFFGRAQYNFADKYYLTATVRADGSSKFGANNKYGIFPAFNGAWRIAGEEFFKKGGLVSDLKLRAGWGVTGNSEGFPANQTINTYVPDGNGGIRKENVANPDLKWESTVSSNIGLDWAMLSGRLSGSFDYFQKSTKDLLFALPAMQPDVATTSWSNIDADIRNQGLEVLVNYDVLSGKKLSWDISLNSTFLKNEVKSLAIPTARAGAIYGQRLSGAFAQPITVGYPLYSFFVPEFLGYDDKGLTKLGQTKNFGSPFPKAIWGLTNNFAYGNWFASIFVNGQKGGYVLNNTALALMGAPAIKQGNNSDSRWMDAKQSYSDGLTVSSKYVEKSDFVRLSNLVIGYNFKVKSNYINSLGLSLTGQNLLLLTKYKGLDPEITNPSASMDGIPSNGIDYISYPKNKTFSLGLNVGF